MKRSNTREVATTPVGEAWALRLYIAGQSPKSLAAISNLHLICERHLAARYAIEVIDLLDNPQLAEDDNIISVPTLVRRHPGPARKIIGDLCDTEMTLAGLELRPRLDSSTTAEPRSETGETAALRARLAELEAALAALREGSADAVVTANGTIGLKGSEGPYLAFFEAMNEGGLTCDSEGRILHCNPRLASMLGQTVAALRGSLLRDLVSPEDRTRVAELLLEEAVGTCEAALTTPTARKLPVQLSFRPMKLDYRHLMCLVVTDLSEHVRDKTTLQESHEAHRCILETTLDGYWCVDSEGKLLDLNPAYGRQSGYTRDELLGMRIGDLESMQSPAETAGHMRQAMEHGSDQFESMHRRKDGSIWHVEVSVTFSEIAGGRFFVFLRDISQRKLAEAELRQHRDHLEQLVAQREQALRESETLNRSILNSVPAEIAVIDSDGVIRAANAAWQRSALENSPALGQPTPPAGVGASYFTCCQIDDEMASPETAQARAGIQAVLEGRIVSFSMEYSCHTPLQQRWLAMSVTPLVQDAKNCVVITHTNITERKKAEARINGLLNEQRLIFDNAQVGIVMVQQRRIVKCNQRFVEMFGYTRPDQIEGHSMEMLYCSATDYQDLGEFLYSSLALNGAAQGEIQMRRRDGSGVWVMIAGRPLDPRAVLDGSIWAYTDITERKQSESELRIAAASFESQEAMVITDANCIILRVNSAFTTITGYAADEVVGRSTRILKSSRHDAEFYRAMWESIVRSGGWQGEIWDRRKTGEEYLKWLTISAVKNSDGVVTHYVGAHYDISERKNAEEKINRLAFFDQLTGLPNRTLLRDRLQQAMAAGRRYGSFGAVLFIDLDHFKTLNDTLGHAKGDLLLEQVAKRLVRTVREGDTVARLGGDEFVVVLSSLNGVSQEAAGQTELIAEKILTALRQPYQLGDVVHRSSASIGATLFLGYETSIDELLKQADLAMYKSKDTGRNGLNFFDPVMGTLILERVALEDQLRQALPARQFLLHYQPQVLHGQGITGAEVLVRWQHPQRGMVSPAEFITLAEETGLILPLGQWVLETACTQLAHWARRAEMAHLTVAVNVSARQFRQRDFVAQVLAVLDATGADPRLLKLELTESMLVSNVDDMVGTMVALRDKGVEFSLDDFGTGFSSLSYLKRLPLNQLKIDQSFVRDVVSNTNDAAIAKTVIALAKNLGLSVIAEGVETEAQRDFLANSGCHAYQGYFFSRPLPLADYEALVDPGDRQAERHAH